MRKEARRLRAEGLSLRAIAARLGIALSTASVWTRGAAPPAEAPVALGSPVPGAAEPPRVCPRCGRERLATEFNRGQWWCRACFRAYYAEHRARHRARGNALKARRVAEAQAFVLERLRRRP